ncbi:MAG: hypothetical protein M0R41_09490 [Methylobacter tundripaludum]|nr:hypothetical protein [Methylobacter tundripaludum]
MLNIIDFTCIRGDTAEGQRSAFEQLVCHLAELDGNVGEFRRIEGAGGDGGVEALRILPSGGKIGYQAKFHLSRESIDWKKIDSSVQTALKQHPELELYVVALPCSFTGTRAARGGSTEGVWGKWDTQVKQWKTWATMNVDFEPWTAFELEAALLKPNAQHLLKYFFDKKIFTQEWIQRHLDRTIHDLQARYSPDEHVDTESLKPFDVIFRRENVCQDLQVVFDIAQRSNPRAAASLVENANIPEADMITVENSRNELLSLEEAINWSAAKEWPVCYWLMSWYSFTRQLMSVDSPICDRIQTEKSSDRDTLRQKVNEATKVYDLIQPKVFGGHWAHLLPIDGSRAALFVGRAGRGKSHVLARGAEVAWAAGAPVIHLLGQHILDNDPRQSILNRLELTDWTFFDLLSALNLAAETAGTRALLVIDAMNEGCGIDVWRNHLASFVREINAHDRIVLVVSCREEYLEYIVPQEIIAEPRVYPETNGNPPKDCAPLGKFIRFSVNGFRTEKEREAALQMFMDEKGISRPTAPLLDEEFFNPLFMSSVCRSMAKAGIKVFPRGLHGAREVFDFVLTTKAKALGTRHDGTERLHSALLSALNSLAGFMVKHNIDCVPLSDAMALINSEFGSFPINGQTWLDVLEGSDILRRDVEKTQNVNVAWGRPNEVVRFSFQRLQDNLMAEHLIGYCQDIENAFGPDAPFAFLVKRSIREDGIAILKPTPRWASVLGALWSFVAEKHQIELFNIPSFFGSPDVHFYPNDFRKIFLASIRERSCAAFTKDTRRLLDRLWEDEPEKKLAIFLSTACVPGHAWNADFLAEKLFSFPLADRDSKWSRFFADNSSELSEQSVKVINWALNVNAQIADVEVVRLAGITLTWLLAVTNRSIRDSATKALVNLQIGVPTLFPYLMNLFRTIDDFYILDRLLASGYGAICLAPSNERLTTAAKAVADVIFGTVEPPVYLSIRDWARSILERAAERNLAPKDFNMAQVRQPFGSASPMFNVGKDDLEAIAITAGDNTISRSCRVDDFFIYEIKPAISSFTETLLTDPPPLTQDERADRFEYSVYDLGGAPELMLEALLSTVSTARKRQNMSDEIIHSLETAFVSCLPEPLRSDYATELAPKIHRQFQPPETRNPEPVGLWVGRRAYELGWTKERFPHEQHSSGRKRQVIERIGKKYQWMALEEVKARLADNFWVEAEYDNGTRIYQSRQDAWVCDRIDPTILPPREDNPPFLAPSFIGPPPLLIEEVEGAEFASWPFRADHFDNPEVWLTGKLDDRPCLIADWSESIDDEHSFDAFRRQAQAFVSLVVHKAGDRQKVVNGFLKNHDHGIDGWSLKEKPDGYFVYEFSLMPSDEIPFLESARYGDAEIATPIFTGYIEDDSDCSIQGSVRYTVPHPRIHHALGVSIPDPRNSGLWVLPDGQVFLRRLEGRGSPLLLDKKCFDEWCLSEGLEYTWVYIGERSTYEEMGDAYRRRTLGAAWYENEIVKFKNNQRDD